MKRKLGISIYPEKSTVEKDKEYIEKAHKYGFSKIFTCLLSVDKPIDIIKKEFIEIIDFADRLEMEVILDISPAVFDKLNISYNDLSFFKELGAAGIRLDLGFDGLKEAQLTYDKTDLKIELNILELMWIHERQLLDLFLMRSVKRENKEKDDEYEKKYYGC